MTSSTRNKWLWEEGRKVRDFFWVCVPTLWSVPFVLTTNGCCACGASLTGLFCPVLAEHSELWAWAQLCDWCLRLQLYCQMSHICLARESEARVRKGLWPSFPSRCQTNSSIFIRKHFARYCFSHKWYSSRQNQNFALSKFIFHCENRLWTRVFC